MHPLGATPPPPPATILLVDVDVSLARFQHLGLDQPNQSACVSTQTSTTKQFVSTWPITAVNARVCAANFPKSSEFSFSW